MASASPAQTSPYSPRSGIVGRPDMRVDPRYPLGSPITSQNAPMSQFVNGGAQFYDSSMGRSSSRRRKTSSQDYSTGMEPAVALPMAPDVPRTSQRGPPISYRDPYSNGDNRPQRSNSQKSFAARAGVVPDNVDPFLANSATADNLPKLKTNGHTRSEGTNQVSGINYIQMQQPITPSYSSSTTGPVSGERSPSGAAPKQHKTSVTKPSQQSADPAAPSNYADNVSPQSYSGRPVQQSINTNISPIYPDSMSPPVRAGSRRISAGTAESRKEWAADRSPLQRLEVKLNDISKEEKRARVQEAEQLLRESKVTRSDQLAGPGTDAGMDRTSSRRVGSSDTRRRISQHQNDQTKATSTGRRTTEHQPAGRGVAGIADSVVSQGQRQSSRPITKNMETLPKQSPTLSSLPTSPAQAQQDRRRSRDMHNHTRDDRGVRFLNDYAEDPAMIPSGTSAGRTYQSRDRRLEDPARSSPREERRTSFQQSQNLSRENRLSSGITRDDPPQKQQLRSHGVERPEAIEKKATLGGASYPGPDHTVFNHVHTQKVPPQAAAGIEARQKIGFGSSLDGTADVPTHHRHSLTEKIHRMHHGAEIPSVPQAGPPRHLNDWKKGSIARLTIADLTADNESTREKKTWWEGSTSGSQRRTSGSRMAEKAFAPPDGGYEDSNGKTEISSRGRIGLSTLKVHPTEQVVRARQYIGYDGTSRVQRRNRSWLRRPNSIIDFGTSIRALQGVSSHSCTCRSIPARDVSYIVHVCKPYLSKTLTRSMRCIRIRVPAVPTTFNPPLLLKCGPLLRYTGLKRDNIEKPTTSRRASVTELEIWRGSVMIVTVDAQSSYEPAPTLRLFHQPMDLLPPPPQQVDGEDDYALPSEYVDPIAGLPKMTRSGKTVWVKPVEDFQEAVDYSLIENDDGLYEETRTAVVPTGYGKADELLGRSPLPSAGRSKSNQRTKQRAGKFREVRGVRLHAERGVTFWRFNLEVELGKTQARIAYRINNAASIGFWVPAKGQTMNMMFHSCNGFSLSVNPPDFCGPDPLWRDVLNSHQTKPFHVMIGGGDQIYNDAVMEQTTLFKEWTAIKNPLHKHEAPFTAEMQDELEMFYLERYSMWFSQGFFGMANSQIPMVNIWDDHDIIDGYGSYPDHFMRTPVFCGLGSVAFKYYMLFQHQSVVDEGEADEPSWLLGASRGPYINELNRSVFMFLGKHIAFLGLDCRTERTRDEILSEESYNIVFDRCHREIIQGDTKHLIVLLGVPIAYPRLVWLENILTSRVMDPIKAVGRAGLFRGFLNKFDGGVEILDDLDDHWTAKNHKHERNWFVQQLQDLAAAKSVRITILGGDVHLAAIGQFYSSPKLKIPKDWDHRYMPNVISSAIVNTPPPEMMGDILNKRNKVHHLDRETDEDMIPMFTHNVDGKARNNKHLLPRRNWCSISEYHPGSTPLPTPPATPSEASDESYQGPPQTRLQRTLSLTRGDIRPGRLLRRLSQRGASASHALEDPTLQASMKSPPLSAPAYGYFSTQPEAPTSTDMNGTAANVTAPLPTRPINTFHRRPTNLSEKAAAKGGATAGEINLENGLDIVLNCEVSQRDPAGVTVPYRLLVPALWYQDTINQDEATERKASWFQRLGSRRGSRRSASRQGAGNWGGSPSETESEGYSEDEQDDQMMTGAHSPQIQKPTRQWSFGFGQSKAVESKLERGSAGGASKQESDNIGGGNTLERNSSVGGRKLQKQKASGVYSNFPASEAETQPAPTPPVQSMSPQDRLPEQLDMINNTRRSSKFDKDGNSSFSGTTNDIRGGVKPSAGSPARAITVSGGGYSGIEAYREKKGWRRLLPV